jgi:flagellar hook-associated protein 2
MATTGATSSTTTTSTSASSLSSGTSAALASTPEAVAKANKAAAQKLISALGAGSGVDVASLAQNLVDAEGAPQKNAINAKITKNEARISGYSAMSFVLSQVNTAMTALKDQSSFNTLSASNTNTAAFDVSASTSAATGAHDIEVLRLAKAQRTVSDGLASPTTTLNGGLAISVSVYVGAKPTMTSVAGTGDAATGTRQTATVSFTPLLAGQSVTVAGLTYKATSATTAAEVAAAFSGLAGNATSSTTAPKGTVSGTLTGFSAGVSDGTGNLTFTSTAAGTTAAFAMSSAAPKLTIAAGQDTPQGIVNAINAASNGVTAQLVNTGDGTSNPYQIILTGKVGSSNVFSYSAQDANGADISGVSFNPANATNQTAADAKVKVDGITYVRTSNALTDVVPGLTINLKGLTTSAASVNLTRDNTPIKDKINALVTSYNDAISIFKEVSDTKSTLPTYGATLVGDSTLRSIKQQLRGMFTGASSTPGSSVGALWQLGISLDQSGVMSLDATKLDTALTNNYDDVVKTFTGNKNGISALSTENAGIAGDAFKKLTKMLGNTGALLTQSESANTQNTKYKDDLTKLQTRLDAMLKRYQTQFSKMDSIVGGVNTQKTSLKATFDGMMASLTGKN